MALQFTYTNLNGAPPSLDYCRRKVWAVPYALSNVAHSVYQLALSILPCVESGGRDVALYRSVRHLEEAVGWLVTLIFDTWGQGLVTDAKSHQLYYTEFEKIRNLSDKEILDRFDEILKKHEKFIRTRLLKFPVTEAFSRRSFHSHAANLFFGYTTNEGRSRQMERIKQLTDDQLSSHMFYFTPSTLSLVPIERLTGLRVRTFSGKQFQNAENIEEARRWFALVSNEQLTDWFIIDGQPTSELSGYLRFFSMEQLNQLPLCLNEFTVLIVREIFWGRLEEIVNLSPNMLFVVTHYLGKDLLKLSDEALTKIRLEPLCHIKSKNLAAFRSSSFKDVDRCILFIPMNQLDYLSDEQLLHLDLRDRRFGAKEADSNTWLTPVPGLDPNLFLHNERLEWIKERINKIPLSVLRKHLGEMDQHTQLLLLPNVMQELGLRNNS